MPFMRGSELYIVVVPFFLSWRCGIDGCCAVLVNRSSCRVIGWSIRRSICSLALKLPCTLFVLLRFCHLHIYRSHLRRIANRTDRFSPLPKRQLAFMFPVLACSTSSPFPIPFEIRVSISMYFVANNMANRGVDRHRSGRARVSVRRGSVAQHGFDKMEGAYMKTL